MGFTLAVELDVTLPQVQDPEQAARIVAAAHQNTMICVAAGVPEPLRMGCRKAGRGWMLP